MSISKILGAAAVAALAIGASGPAAALPDHEYYYIYYIDAAHSDWAGVRIMTCMGNTYSQGSTTPYMSVMIEEPCGSPLGQCNSAIYVNGMLTCG